MCPNYTLTHIMFYRGYALYIKNQLYYGGDKRSEINATR